MKQYQIVEKGLRLSDVPGYDDCAKKKAECELETLKHIFRGAQIQERDVSEWRTL